MTRELHMMVTSLSTATEAERIAALLVEESLVACAQVDGGCRSWYRWQGKVTMDEEVVLRLKIRADRLEACRDRLQELHPYDIPMILSWPVAWASPDYLAWAHEEDGS